MYHLRHPKSHSQQLIALAWKVVLTSLAFTVLSLAVATSTYAGVVQLTSPSQLSQGAITGIYLQPNNTILPSPYSLTAGGNTLTFTQSGNFLILTQGVNFAGDFPPSTKIISTLGRGPITIDFANPVREFGFLMQNNVNPQLINTFSVFNGAMLLGSFNGSLQPGTRLPLFFDGARATDSDVITRIIVTGAPGFGPDDFVIGPVTFVVEPVPEPTTLLLLGTGLAGVGVAVRKRRKGKESEGG